MYIQFIKIYFCRNLRFLLLFAMIVLIFAPSCVFAQDISLDGTFEDWGDKPSLDDTKNDEMKHNDIYIVKWFADASSKQCFFYIERDPMRSKNEYNYNHVWTVRLFFNTYQGQKTAVVDYNPDSTMVEVELYDENDRGIWKSKGKWGDPKDTQAAFEFSIPMSELIGSMISGYEFDFYVMSESDRVPDQGVITVSTVSTYPVITAITAFVIAVVGIVLFKRKTS